MTTSEKNEDNDYKDFDLKNYKDLMTIKTKKSIKQIIILNEKKILVMDEEMLCFVFDLKSNKSFDINIENIYEIINIYNIIIIRTSSKIIVIEIQEDSFEIIQSLEIASERMVKLPNQKILLF